MTHKWKLIARVTRVKISERTVGRSRVLKGHFEPDTVGPLAPAGECPGHLFYSKPATPGRVANQFYIGIKWIRLKVSR